MAAGERTKKSLENIFFGLINRFVLMIFPFAVKTILIKKLGTEYLGLNNLFSSILQVLSLSELGVGTAMVYSMYKPMAENDNATLCALLNLYKKLYRIIGCVILTLGVLIMPFLDKLIKGSYPADINLYLLYLIYLANTVLSYFLFAYKKSLLEADQQNSIESRINTVASIGMYIGQIIALLTTSNYYVYSILLPLSTLFINIFRNIVVSQKYHDIICKGKMNADFIKDIYKKVGALVGHRIGTTVITSADSIVISAFLGLHVLAVYSNYYYILSSLIAVVTIFYTATTASIGNSLILADSQKNYTDFMTFTFLNNWLVGWFAICLICLYQPFMKLWMGEHLLFPFHMVVLMALYFYAWLSRRIGLTYKDAAGLWCEDFWKPYIGAVVNVVTNILLVNWIGIEGVVISTIIVMAFIYFPWETKVLFTKLFPFDIKEYCIKYYGYAVVTIIVAACTYWLCSFITFEGIGGLVCKGLLCVFIPNALFGVMYFRTAEFREALHRVKGIVGRKVK